MKELFESIHEELILGNHDLAKMKLAQGMRKHAIDFTYGLSLCDPRSAYKISKNYIEERYNQWIKEKE